MTTTHNPSDARSDGQWIPYAESRPPQEGPYQWRVPSVAVPGLVVTCVAHMRERGAGYERAVSPLFDYWDGYRLHVPKGLEWREIAPGAVLRRWCDVTDLAIEGEQPCACPYCGNAPTLKGRCISNFGGTVMSSDPHNLNAWRLECCSWARTPEYKDPRELIAKRNSILARIKEPA